MSKEQSLAVAREISSALSKVIILAGAAVLAPLFGQQIISGPIVNAILFISVYFLDLKKTILIALVPSAIALAVGILPALSSPIIPFIMIGNVVLVVSFRYLKDKNYWLAMVSASVLKFIFLFSASELVINLLLQRNAAAPRLAAMMSWPQLFTALAGGLLAYAFLKGIKRI